MNSVAVLCLVQDASLRERLIAFAALANASLFTYASPDELLMARHPLRAGLLVLEKFDAAKDELLGYIEQLAFHTRVVLIADNIEIPFAVQAVKCGCADVLLHEHDLTERLQHHLAEESAYVARTASLQQQLNSLSARERDVFKLMVAGASVKQVAATLGIAPKTASEHVSRILEKMRVANPAQLLWRLYQKLSTSLDPRLRGWLSYNLSQEQVS